MGQCCSNDATSQNEVAEKGAVRLAKLEEVVPHGALSAAAPRAKAAEPKKEFTIKLEKKDGARLGVDVDLSDGVALMVEAINPGLVDSWNKANPGKEVKPGYRILSVNGSKGSATDMAEMCKTSATLEMVMQVGEEPAP